MAHLAVAAFAQAFDALSQEERLFLYLIRHWAQAHRPGAQRCNGQRQTRTRQDASLDLFLRCFAQALPEPLYIKPPQCRCAIHFHEATLLAFFRAVLASDHRGMRQALGDLVCPPVIERLAAYLRPILCEIEMAR